MPKKSATPSTVPPDDPRRKLTLARPNGDSKLPSIGIVGDTYTILLTGKDTRGRFVSSTCTSRPAEALLPIGTISRNHSPC
jgi:hypothetical protein